MNRKTLTKLFYIPVQLYFLVVAVFLIITMNTVIAENITHLLGGVALAIGFVPLILYKNMRRKLKPYGSIYAYYGYEAFLFILPILLYYASMQNDIIEIIAFVFLFLTVVYTRVVTKLFMMSEEKITNIIPEVKKNTDLKVIIASIFLFTYIILNVWFGYIKPTYITTPTTVYEYIVIVLILVSVLVLEYKKIVRVPNKNGYYISLVLLILYLAVPLLYSQDFKLFIAYTVVYATGYMSLYLFGFEEFPFLKR
ncbi:hypothetical protein BN85410040 [Alteracholeplasma palmae J233]|uniref:Uncharacterized protein n=1 Tax=Alteracholeplasma palmae (strain ATCC 49389 / J233) TaxID=1318466 RepID=U4KRZ6_ALTPJ|nr:hypothetical protein [Alteracholeplasma palmae]CCV64581.1 hypothetical protein BN85410040 [Alteracholeplasma palmae J233]